MNASAARINRAKLLPGLAKRLLFVAILTLIANSFFWRHGIGINLPLYAGLLGLGAIASTRGLQSIHPFWMFGLLLATSILAGVNAVSLPNFFCLATVLTLLSGVCFYRTRRPWQRFFRAAISLCGTPLRWVLVGVIAYRLYRGKLRKTPDWRLVRQAFFVSFTTAIPVLLIGSFLISGNLILGTWFNSVTDLISRIFRNVSVLHPAFLMVFATIALGFAWPGRWRWRSPFLFQPATPTQIGSTPVRIWMLTT
jgi:hypothetical protein